MHTHRTATNSNRIEWINAWIRLYGGTVRNADAVWHVDYKDNPDNWTMVDGISVLTPIITVV